MQGPVLGKNFENIREYSSRSGAYIPAGDRPNIWTLYTRLEDNEVDTVPHIFHSCLSICESTMSNTSVLIIGMLPVLKVHELLLIGFIPHD